MTSCVVLFSGGLDSTTALYWALSRYGRVHALTFDYGQRHRIEVARAGKIARKLGIPRSVLRVDLTAIGGSALTDRRIPLPRSGGGKFTGNPPITYVPFRNGIFLAMAAAWAEARRIPDLVCGFHVVDSPEYPDTRQDFVRAMNSAINKGTGAACGGPRMRIRAPFIRMGKADIIREGLRIGVDYSNSISCYAGGETPCGFCSSCRIRRNAWKAVGAEDPLLTRLRKRDER